MIIGIPKEIKNNENRVAITPAGAAQLIANGHDVFVQKTAGVGSGFPDERYIEVGVQMLNTIEEVYAKAEMIIKVKEPIEAEYKLVREGQILFTYFHFASCEALTHAMIESKAICIAYETVELADRTLPLLMPMSEVAGRMSVQEGAKYLEKTFGGSGILLGGVAGVSPAKVLVIGGGVVGTEAAKMAAGLGASVTIADINLNRLRYLDDVMPANVSTLFCTPYSIAELCKTHDLIIGAVLIPGAKAPKLVTLDMIKTMQPGTVLVDVAIDQGGCFECAKPTTHDNPTFNVADAIMYSVANMPGAVPRTSTQALTNATLAYAIAIANKGWKAACQNDEALAKGLNISHGKIVYKGVADAFNLPFVPKNEVL
ncbi:MAG: alanine dehydrogenase [Mangrovibacterium sp.]